MSLRFMLCLLPIVIACGGKDDDEGPQAGDPCEEGAECIGAEFCLIQIDETEGVCTPTPSGCADACDCDAIDESLGDYCDSEEGDTGGAGLSCFSINERATLNCF